jgi:DNA-binding response OmpR family regulator
MENAPVQQATILIIDDSPAIRGATARLLKSAGYKVFEASTGVDGLGIALEQRPDIVLLDVVLPDADGRDLCRQMKSDPRLERTFIILASNLDASSHDPSEGMEQGAHGFIRRPISNREMLARVAVFVGLKQAGRGAKLQ